MKSIIIFLLGMLTGIVLVVVWTCLVVGAEADERERKMFEKHIKEKENEKQTVEQVNN